MPTLRLSENRGFDLHGKFDLQKLRTSNPKDERCCVYYPPGNSELHEMKTGLPQKILKQFRMAAGTGLEPVSAYGG